MKHICIIGSGFSGGILASEISEDPKIKVTLLDCDNIKEKFDDRFNLKKISHHIYPLIQPHMALVGHQTYGMVL